MRGRQLWSNFVAEKFQFKPEWLVKELAYHSGFDIEYFFRKIYVYVYQLKCDRGHTNWNVHLSWNSLVWKNGSGREYFDNLAFKMRAYRSYNIENMELRDEGLGNNCWENLTHKIFLSHCINVDINHLEYLVIGKVNISPKKQNNIFHQLDIEVDNTRLY